MTAIDLNNEETENLIFAIKESILDEEYYLEKVVGIEDTKYEVADRADQEEIDLIFKYISSLKNILSRLEKLKDQKTKGEE